MRGINSTLFIFVFLFTSSIVFGQKTTSLGFHFEDENSLVDCGLITEDLSNFTIETWVYISTYRDNYFLASEGSEKVGERSGFVLRTSEGDNKKKALLKYGGNNSWHSVEGSTEMDTMTWYHIAVTYDGTTLKLYVDGILDGSSTPSASMTAAGENLIMGEGAQWRNRRLEGRLSDVRIWSVVKTRQEIVDNKDKYLESAPAGLVANWKLDEGTGTDISDLVGNYNAKIGSGVTWEVEEAGPTSNSLVFDASNENSLVDCGLITEDLSNFTFETWVYISTYRDNYFLASEGSEKAGERSGFVLRTSEGDNKKKVLLKYGGNNSWHSVEGTTEMDTMTWYHVAVTYDGTTLKLYMDGVLDGSSTPSASMTAAAENLIMGEGAQWRNRRLEGKLSDVRIWSVAKTRQEIVDNKDKYLESAPTGLVANWKLDEGTGTDISDLVGNYNTTIGSGVSWDMGGEIQTPSYASATTDTKGTVVEVTFSKDMADPSSEAASFTVMVDGSSNAVTGAALKSGDAKTIVLTLTNAVSQGQTVTVAYTEGTLESADGNKLASFEATAVTNRVNLTALNSLSSDAVKVFPNPFEDYVYVETISQIANVSLITLNGQEIEINYSINNNSATLNTNDVKAGIYIIKVITAEQEIAIHKIIKN